MRNIMEPSANIDLKNTVTKGKVTGLWRLMRGYHGIYLAAIISVGLAALSRTGLYVLLGKFVDEILPSENIRQLLPLVVIGLLLLALLQGGFTFLGGRLAAKTAEGVARRLRNYLYNHLQRLSFSQNDRLQTGDLLQRSTSDV
ncbi:MAG TPA: ABC transporter ATP-binding protein, partial [Anaerolineae bacterium]|nr:ABC transporter ATP-binding protein [Anaerolineae bacterium]